MRLTYIRKKKQTRQKQERKQHTASEGYTCIRKIIDALVAYESVLLCVREGVCHFEANFLFFYSGTLKNPKTPFVSVQLFTNTLNSVSQLK